MPTQDDEAFKSFLAELADGKRWELLRSDGWEEFAERLSSVIAELSPRRRQALVMLLFALSERMITPEMASDWISKHDVESDQGVEGMIRWLRTMRPPS